ncbi:unnamed protein product, partial [Brenthis ino]
MTFRPLWDDEIAKILTGMNEDSEDGMEDDDDSVADPDYRTEDEMEQEQFSGDENEYDELNLEEIIHSLEDNQPDPSPSTSAVPTGSQQMQPVVQPRKPAKLNLSAFTSLLGDSGYFCKKYLLTPFVRPATPVEENYNRAHITTRNTIERCFGVWKRHFPCLQKGITLRKITTILNVIVATAVLHNIAIEMNDEQPPQDLSVDFDLEEASLEELHSAFQYGEDTSVRTTLVNTVFSG